MTRHKLQIIQLNFIRIVKNVIGNSNRCHLNGKFKHSHFYLIAAN